jgi:hypothetical protein
MKRSIVVTVCVAAFVLMYVCGCVRRNGVVLRDEFSRFDRNTWRKTEGRVSVDDGILTIDCEGNKKGYIQYFPSTSKWRVVELRARVDKVYGAFVGDIIANPGTIYYNRMGTFCIWENSQKMFAAGDQAWHIWKIVRTENGVDIYMDGVYQITNTKYDPKEVTLGNLLADQDHGMRVSYDWIKVLK